MTNNPNIVLGTKQEFCKLEMKYRQEKKEFGRGVKKGKEEREEEERTGEEVWGTY